MNHFTIYFSDLTVEAQESIKKLVASRIKNDQDEMKEVRTLAEEKIKDYAPGIPYDPIEESIIDEKVDDIISREFDGRGQV